MANTATSTLTHASHAHWRDLEPNLTIHIKFHCTNPWQVHCSTLPRARARTRTPSSFWRWKDSITKHLSEQRRHALQECTPTAWSSCRSRLPLSRHAWLRQRSSLLHVKEQLNTDEVCRLEHRVLRLNCHCAPCLAADHWQSTILNGAKEQCLRLSIPHKIIAPVSASRTAVNSRRVLMKNFKLKLNLDGSEHPPTRANQPQLKVELEPGIWSRFAGRQHV